VAIVAIVAIMTSNRVRMCYVMLTPVASVYRTLRAGRYDDLFASLDVAATRIAGSTLRLGSYGDPAALPHDVWIALLATLDIRINGARLQSTPTF
jgi:hypothetical protein